MYIDLLPRFKNAAQVGKRGFRAPYSNMDFAVAKLLEREGFLAEVKRKKTKGRACIEARIAYDDGRPVLRNFSLKSTPGRHLYRKVQEIKRVRQGYGVAVVSTSQGIMTGKEARQKNMGGEYLFEIW